jgi:hypothetical protein
MSAASLQSISALARSILKTNVEETIGATISPAPNLKGNRVCSTAQDKDLGETGVGIIYCYKTKHHAALGSSVAFAKKRNQPAPTRVKTFPKRPNAKTTGRRRSASMIEPMKIPANDS